jgi:hypothetical protein
MEEQQNNQKKDYSFEIKETTDFLDLIVASTMILRAGESEQTMEDFIKENNIPGIPDIEKIYDKLMYLSLYEGRSILHTTTGMFRKTFGVPMFEELNLQDEVQVDNIKRDAGLIREELNEFLEALEKKDHTEMIDAVGDLRVVLQQLCFSCGLSPEVLNMIDLEVSRSNQSKLFKDSDEVLEGKLTYEKEGVGCFVEQTSDNSFVLKRNSDNKVLKNKASFFKPSFDFLRTIINFK